MKETNLYDLLRHYAKFWYIIVILTMFGLVGGIVYNDYVQTPLYKSNVKLLLVTSQSTAVLTDETRINNYIELIKSRKVLDPVISQYNGTISYDSLTQDIDVTNQKSTQVIDIAVHTTESVKSKNIANSIADSFKEAVYQLYGNNDVTVVDPAVTNSAPYNVNKSLQISVAAFGAFLAGIVLVFFMYDLKLDMAKLPAAQESAKQTKPKSKKLKKRAGFFSSIRLRVKRILTNDDRKPKKKTSPKSSKTIKVVEQVKSGKKLKQNTKSTTNIRKFINLAQLSISRMLLGGSKMKVAVVSKTNKAAKTIKLTAKKKLIASAKAVQAAKIAKPVAKKKAVVAAKTTRAASVVKPVKSGKQTAKATKRLKKA